MKTHEIMTEKTFEITDPYKDLRPPYPSPKGKIWKTGGNGEWFLVDDVDENGKRIKRRKPTNYTPPKKKRKRRKR